MMTEKRDHVDTAGSPTGNAREMLKKAISSLPAPGLFVAGLLVAPGLLGGCVSGTGGGVSPATAPVPTPPTTTPPAVPMPTPPSNTAGSPEAQEGEVGEQAGELEGDDSEDGGSEDGTRGETGGSGRPGPARTSEERSESLDEDLQESLSEFDRKMLEEQETLARRRTSASAIGGGAGGGSGEGGTDGGEGAGTGSGSAAGGSAGGTESETSQPDRGRTDGGGAGAREPGEPVADESNDAAVRNRIPPDIPDGEDDDIVARQLREAAVEEDDPRLRERLWDEYRRYKGLPVKGDPEETEPDDEEPPQEDPGDRREP